MVSRDTSGGKYVREEFQSGTAAQPIRGNGLPCHLAELSKCAWLIECNGIHAKAQIYVSPNFIRNALGLFIKDMHECILSDDVRLPEYPIDKRVTPSEATLRIE